MSSTSTRRKIWTMSFLYPSKPKPTKNLWRQENHACMRRFLETVKRPVEFAFKYHSSINPAWCSMKISLQRMPFKKAL